jgi:glutathione S-transferase
MLEVYHHPVCPFSRKLRIVLNERDAGFELFTHEFWNPKRKFLALNPAGSTPTIVVSGSNVISGNFAINEFLEEIDDSKHFISGNPLERAEIRRLVEWFDIKFYNEVTRYVLFEKIIKNISRVGSPNSQALRAAKSNILYHLDYIAHLTRDHSYLVGDKPTLADFTAAAQISVLDFAGDVPWHHNARAKEWYSLIKSRPSFRSILHDRVNGVTPPSHYNNPDF